LSITYAQGMGDLLDAMARAFRPDAVNILMAHCFATEVQLGGGENELTVTMDYAVSPARFPGTATYIALGHVHKPQAVVSSAAPARYAGSLLQLDFGEREQPKSVTVVEAAPGKPARIREIPLSASRPLLDIAGTLDELREKAPDWGDAWLRVTVRTEGPVPGIADAVREVLPNAVVVRVEHALLEDEEQAEPVLNLAPREQFVRYYRTKHAAEPPDAILKAFAEVRAAITEGAGWAVDASAKAVSR
jgi:exonuclease SbcD